MAELRNGGTSRSAVASSVRTAPSASRRPTSVDSSGAIRSRMRSSAASTVSVETAARAALELVGMRTSLGAAVRGLQPGRWVSQRAPRSSERMWYTYVFVAKQRQVPKDGALRVGEAAEVLGISVDTLRRWAGSGEVKVRRSA